MIINLEYDASAQAAPQSFRDGMQAAANMLQNAFDNNITINIAVSFGIGSDGLPLQNQGFSYGQIGYNNTSGVGISENYSDLRTLLLNNEGSANDITAAVP